MDVLIDAVALLLIIVGLVGLGALLYRIVAGSPTEREQALTAKIDALKTANYLGGEYFRAQEQMREEMSRASRHRSPTRGQAGVGRGRVIDGEFYE